MFKSVPGMDPLKELEWLLNGIRQNGRNAQKTILYMRQPEFTIFYSKGI
jgi:hypothetical protein